MTVQEHNFVDSVRETMASPKVFIRCKVGTLPMDNLWDKVNNRKRVDGEILATDGKTVIDRWTYRNIETRIGDGSGGSLGYEVLDKNNAEDMEFLETVKEFIASGDKRVVECGVRIDEGNPHPIPFARWDELKPSTCLEMLAHMLGDDDDANQEKLAAAVRYELSCDNPRQEILSGLETLANAGGYEAYDDDIEDES